MWDRFLGSRIEITYHVTSRLCKAGEASAAQSAAQSGASSGVSDRAQAPNTMTKQGTLSIRPIDLTVGAALLCLAATLCHMVKGICR